MSRDGVLAWVNTWSAANLHFESTILVGRTGTRSFRLQIVWRKRYIEISDGFPISLGDALNLMQRWSGRAASVRHDETG